MLPVKVLLNNLTVSYGKMFGLKYTLPLLCIMDYTCTYIKDVCVQ